MTKQALLALPAAGLSLLALTACSGTTPVAAPPTNAPVVTTTAGSAIAVATSTSTATRNHGCEVNPATAPVPTADPYASVPAADDIQVTLAGLPSGTVQVTGAPVEMDVTLCNNSPVAYPQVAVVFALDHCSCAPGPIFMAKGTVQRFDSASGTWVTVGDVHTATGMDYLVRSTNQQPLPKGKSVTLRYRFSYDPSMTSGNGAVVAEAVIPSGPTSIGQARLPFTVNH